MSNKDVKGVRLKEEQHAFCEQLNGLKFSLPVTHVYNPLEYARSPHERYWERFGRGHKKVIFLGMNPGPYGMAQTGIPFGEVAAVRGWLGIKEAVGRPLNEHPKRPISGYGCERSEVSGRRLWGWAAGRFGKADLFFREHFVMNYCPLLFMGESGSNITPDKLPREERERLLEVCDEHLACVMAMQPPEWLVGIGAFARGRAEVATQGTKIKIGQILHPSPASPKANRSDWGETATREMVEQGIWLPA